MSLDKQRVDRLPEFLTNDESVGMSLEIFSEDRRKLLTSRGLVTSLTLCKHPLRNGVRKIYISALNNKSKDCTPTETLIGDLSADGLEFNNGFHRCAADVCAIQQFTPEEKAAIAQQLKTVVIDSE